VAVTKGRGGYIAQPSASGSALRLVHEHRPGAIREHFDINSHASHAGLAEYYGIFDGSGI
jgi:hypothetical protein